MAAIPDNHLVLAYVPLCPRQPMREFRAFTYDDALGVMVWDRRGYDPDDPAQLAELLEAQALVAKSILVDSRRIRIMPAGWFRGELLSRRGEDARIAEVTAADLDEAKRLANLAALAAEVPKPEPEETAPVDAAEEVPPYGEWTLAALRDEAIERGLAPDGSPRSKAAWISALEADDAADLSAPTD
jgi:hypothetical protein